MKRLLLVLAVGAASCVTIQPVPGGGFEVVPATASASPGQALRFVILAAQGAPPEVTWTVTGGGAVDTAGSFTAPGCSSSLPATITITATSGTFSASSIISVADKVTSVTISPPAVTLAPGAVQQFTATIRSVCFPGGVTQNLRMKKSKDGSLAVVPP